MKNLKIHIFFVLLFLFSIFSSKAQINKHDIVKAANNFILKTSILKNYKSTSEINKLYSGNEIVACSVNLKPEGYIIFTTSENLYPVFSFSEKGKFQYSKFIKNSVFKMFLENLKKQNDFAEKNKTHFSSVIEKNKKARRLLFNNTKNVSTYDYQFGYYLTDTWGGVNCWDNNGNMIYPSNYFTPNHFSPGCVAISQAQILHYYEWPPVGVGSHTDYDNSGSSQGNYYAGFGRTEYDWENMLNNYQNEYSTDTEQRAIGRLMYHSAVSVDMDFENSGSTSNVNRVPNSLSSYFRCTGHYEDFSWSEFQNRLNQNLENKMPVELGIEADNGEQHACVCDGYRYNEGDAEIDKLYHLNMGWWNWYGGNAWYHIFDEFSAIGYTIITGGVFDIIPEPVMNKVVRTSDYHTFIVNWHVSKQLNWQSFELQESYNNGSWTTISSSVTDTLFERTVTSDGIYKYRVRANVGGSFYTDSYSNVGVVQVGEHIFLDFDGDDSFFVNDSYNKLDVSDKWTYEAWVKVDSYNSNDWSVIMDRRTVFSLYLINDADADFAVRFVTRDESDNIGASLRSDNSSVNLEFNKWFHVAVSFDGTYARLFLNGQLIEENNNNLFNLTSSSNALNIGARYWGTYSRYIDGKIDEIILSDTARYTQEFCPDIFNVSKNDERTRLLLNLQYGSGTYLYDASHNFLGITLRETPNTANWQTEQVPVINLQPVSYSACSGNASFDINAVNTDNFQWQINEGSGFTDLIDDANISGSNTNSVHFNEINGLADINILRCILSSSSVPKTCSDNARLYVYGNCTVWDGNSWSNGLPDASKSAIINANYSSYDFLTTDNLTINENDTLFINENYTLKINGDFINNGVLVLKSENADQVPGTFINSGNIINPGKMISQKTFSAPYTVTEENNFFFSSPITETKSISNIFDIQPAVYQNNGKITSWSLVDADYDIKNGEAFLYQYDNDNKAEFIGTFFQGNKNNSFRKLKNDDNFAFVSNPYPSYIDWNAGTGWQKENISPQIYTYDIFNNGNSFNFSVWDGIVGIHSGTQYIKPEDAFFVYMTDYRGKIISDKEVSVSAENITNSYSIPENLIRFQFENENANIYDEAVLYFSDTENSCLKVLPLSENKFYTFLLSGGRKDAVKRIVNPSLDTMISVGFKTWQSEQITFRVTDFTFDENTPVKLKDLWTGQTKMLQNGTTYTFTASSSEPDNRFKLYFGDYVSSEKNIEDNKIKVWSSGNIIFIQNYDSKIINYELFDISGKKLEEGKSNCNLIKITSNTAGINLLKIKNKGFVKTYKSVTLK